MLSRKDSVYSSDVLWAPDEAEQRDPGLADYLRWLQSDLGREFGSGVLRNPIGEPDAEQVAEALL